MIPERRVDPIGEPLTVYVMSDSSGETAAHVVQAALCQFAPEVTTIHRLTQIRSTDDILFHLDRINPSSALLAYTLVLPEYRRILEQEVSRKGIPSWDLLGPLMAKVSDLTRSEPLAQPGRLHLLDDAYFRRIEAMNFAVHYDDGKYPDRITQADVVLIGVSRSSKTPNCMYLAQQYGLFAANIPLVKGVEPPLPLFTVNKNKIFGLDIDPHHLQGLRLARAESMGVGTATGYSDLSEIREEVSFARTIFREIGCRVIDVSARAVEETSSEIYLYLKQQRGDLR